MDDVHLLAPKGGAETSGGVGHHVGLGRRPGPQPVIDVDGGDSTPGRGSQHQQGEGVRTSRDRAGERRARRGKGAPTQGFDDRPRPARFPWRRWCRDHPATAGAAPARATHRPGSRISANEGNHSGTPPDPAEQIGSAGPLDGVHELLAFGVLAQLGLQPQDLLEELGRPPHLLATLPEDPAETLCPWHRRRARPVHGHVAVTL